jgi:hypothetical protein
MAKSKTLTDPLEIIQDRVQKILNAMSELSLKMDSLSRALKRQSDALSALGVLPVETKKSESVLDTIRSKLLEGATCEYKSEREFELIAPLIKGGWALHRSYQYEEDDAGSWVEIFQPDMLEEMLDLITFPESLEFYIDRAPLDEPLKGFDQGEE